jgi:putative toxin-antitoxin system antitoxin component (TIGR02293 family)
MESGKVKWFDEAKGYGYVSRENGEDVFVHFSAIHASSFKKLSAGEPVQFNVVKGPKGWHAEKIQPLPTGHVEHLTAGGKEVGTLSAKSGPDENDSDPGGRVMLSSIRKSLGVRGALKSDADLVALIEERLPVAAISALMEHGILEKEIYSVIVPRRTLQHRRARKEDLSREESDRAVRLARLAALTEKIFGDAKEGMLWLRSPKKRFHGRTPVDMMATEAGSRLVEEALYQIDEGMAA